MDGEKNVQHPALAEWRKILLRPLHIKLGLIKNFIKPMDQTGSAFKYLAGKFPRLNDAKIKEGVFVGSQICKLLTRSLPKTTIVDLKIHALNCQRRP
jgi:hypothetical protein